MPHVVIPVRGGGMLSYADEVWQREQILLVLLPADGSPAWGRFLEALAQEQPRLRAQETVLVVSEGSVSGFDPPLALVADRWGEITHASRLTIRGGEVTPDVPTLLTWVDATLFRCPECEGEAY